jgi:hypothetical protein
MTRPYRYRYDDSFENEDYFASFHVARWIEGRCMRRAGKDDWGGFAVLHRDLVQWCKQNGTPPIDRVWFEIALPARGHEMNVPAGIEGDARNVLVSGLFLASDAWALEKRR